ncbi:hypothetical protein [Desulfolutivibrio sulfoxidireducens]|uniref:hypothetical protein n=1 Tax=Desulfolutivibrio sulfoxidireducens TaxID=2773299 RepID=UPI00159CF9D4|nr:hypothetical protein [Desulfolutivibrio sulfoxidireducens]
MTMPHDHRDDVSDRTPAANAGPEEEEFVRISPNALHELEGLFPDEQTRHVRVIATPG